MKFYRKLKPFKAISFDLDDTLYNNRPIIERMEKGLFDYLEEKVPKAKGLGRSYWLKHRRICLNEKPELKHDVTQLRRDCIASGIHSLGYELPLARALADDALAYMLMLRNDFSLDDEVVKLLKKLSQRWPLVAITNGNADVHRLGLSEYFRFVFSAGNGRKQKPDPELYLMACRALNLAPESVLHIGDCGHADIYGAISAGCQAVWVNNSGYGSPLKQLPVAEIDDALALSTLLSY